MNEQTNIRTDERKSENYIPVGINAGGIIMSDAQTVAHKNNMAACGFGTDLSADFDRIFVIFALEMHFQRFFRW